MKYIKFDLELSLMFTNNLYRIVNDKPDLPSTIYLQVRDLSISLRESIRIPLYDQLRKEVYVENQARRKAKDVDNIRHTLQS